MPSVATAKVKGPLAPYAEGFRNELNRLGYLPNSREYKVNQMSRLSRWLGDRQLGATDLDDARAAAFMADFRSTRKQVMTPEVLRPLMDWLRLEGVIAPAVVLPTVRRPVDDLLDEYRSWMVTERALALRTIDRYAHTADRFLSGRIAAIGGETGAEALDAPSVTDFLLTELARGVGPGSLQGRVAELRSLLRFLFVSGVTDRSLAEAVPPVPGWKETRVPRRLSVAEVQRLLASCDRTSVVGRRDFAMLVLLSRLGLRAAEVAGLTLGSFNWRAGEVVVHGKSRRSDPLPVPVDVGEAVATYVIEARQPVETDRVFLSVAAPSRPIGPTTVSAVVSRQCVRAGLAPVGAHRLRHALATHLLDRGVQLPEIAQVLRQRDLATTAVYAKVDYTALRELALPWPEAAR